MKGGIGQLMKQAKEMQEAMAKAQENLSALSVCGEAGGGMVKITMNGKHAVQSVKIDDSLIGEDRDMLEDLIAAAINDATRRIAAESESAFSGLTGGLNLPPGMKLPF